jgi:uncharacterized protein involved in exopolysaccharide biosynthesis
MSTTALCAIGDDGYRVNVGSGVRWRSINRVMTEIKQSTESFDARSEQPESWAHHLYARYRRRVTTRLALVALAFVLLGTAGGTVTALIWPKAYGARAEILYSPSPAQSDQQGDSTVDPRLSTQLVILTSRPVLEPIAQKQGRQFDDLSKDVGAQVLDLSDVIQVDARGVTKPAALQTLQAVIANYLTIAAEPTGVAANLTTQLASVQANTQRLQVRVQQLTTAVHAKTATQASLDDARAQLTASQNQEVAIQNNIQAVRLTGQTGSDVQLLTLPYSLPDPVSPQPSTTIGIGALIGAIFAAAVIALSRYRTNHNERE